MQKIMFNNKYGLTQAVLEGRKTQTRRLLKHQPSSDDSKMLFYIFDDDRYYDNPEKDPLWGSVSWKNPDGTKTEINKVAYLIGEGVAIAQSYKDVYEELKRTHGSSSPVTRDFFHKYIQGGRKRRVFRSHITSVPSVC